MTAPDPAPKATFKMVLAWRLVLIAAKLHPPILQDLARSAQLGVTTPRQGVRR